YPDSTPVPGATGWSIQEQPATSAILATARTEPRDARPRFGRDDQEWTKGPGCGASGTSRPAAPCVQPYLFAPWPAWGIRNPARPQSVRVGPQQQPAGSVPADAREAC